MKGQIYDKLLVSAAKWLNQTHIGRSPEEKEAYLAGIEDALTAVFEDTSDGLYPANRVRGEIEDQVFYPEEEQHE